MKSVFIYFLNETFALLVQSFQVHNRAVGGSENSGMPVLYGGHNQPPLVEIGLTDLPKFGGAMAPPAPPGTTGLHNMYVINLNTRHMGKKFILIEVAKKIGKIFQFFWSY